uniref:HTH_48 domain-containing protein n=1 Tax=Heterorhabditis bacteriophora TaxID=37862 RepID=A0A1I7WD13_HETBA
MDYLVREPSTNVQLEIYFEDFVTETRALKRWGRRRLLAIDHNQLKATIEGNPHKTTREVVEELSVDDSTVARHLHQMGKSNKFDKWVPLELNESRKNRRYEICFAPLFRSKSDQLLNRIVTYDEKWIPYDNRQRSAQ